MTAEQFEEAKNLRDDEFAACCELNPEFEVEFYFVGRLLQLY